MQFRAIDLRLLLLAALSSVIVGGAARADVLDGVLEVRSAYVKPEQGVFQLFARVTYPVNDDIPPRSRTG